MATNDAMLGLLRDLLAPVGHLVIKRMFGGTGIYADGVIFALILDDVIYLKADALSEPRFVAENLPRFTYEGKSGLVALPYWRAPERLFDDPDEMVEWAREAIAASRRTTAATRGNAKPTKRRRRST